MHKKVLTTRSFVLISMFFCAFNLFASNDNLEAKNDKIKQQIDDTNKVLSLIKKAEGTLLGNLNQSIQFSKQARELATKLDYQIGIAKSYICVAKTYVIVNNTKVGFIYLNKALVLFQKLKDKENEAICYLEIGDLQYKKGLYADALDMYESSFSNALKSRNKSLLCEIYNSIGKTHGILGNLPEALQNFIISLKIADKIHDTLSIGRSYGNIGLVYIKQNNFELGKKYYLKLLDIAEKKKNKKLLSYAYSDLGNLNLHLNNYEKALQYFKASLVIKIDLKNKTRIAESYDDLGEIYVKTKQYLQAEESFKIALQLYLDDKNDDGKASALYYLANLYTITNKLNIAEKYLKESIQILEKARSKEGLRYCYECFYNLYLKKGNHKKALDFYQSFIIYRDSLLSEENISKTIQTEMQFEFDKKTVADSIRNIEKQKVKDAEIAVTNAELKRERSQFLFLVIGLIIVVLAFFIVYNRFRVTQKQKSIIEKQKGQIIESINYSKKIQDALLPDISEMKETIRNIFVFYKPKDIVSGDFYWFKKIGDYTILACVDCTGHGVPGAFMSTIGSLVMDKITDHETKNPSEILLDLNDEIIRLLRQQKGGELQDGMDLSICIIDPIKKQISFSGARNGVIIVNDKQVQRIKADLLPVGGNYIKKGKPILREFKTHVIDISENDWIYMYTDGFIEQIGGENNLPMNYQQYENMLVSLTGIESERNKIDVLNSDLTKWRGANDRTDDILIIGFQL